MVQPRIFLAPYTCCNEHSTVHFGEQCPVFSSASCRRRSLWNTRTSSSGSPLKRVRRCVHARLGIFQLYWANPTVRGIQQLRKNSIQTHSDIADVLRHIIKNVSERLSRNIQSRSPVTQWEFFLFLWKLIFEASERADDRRNQRGHYDFCTNARDQACYPGTTVCDKTVTGTCT